MNKYKTIGIIGGMGPEGTVEMYTKIFKYFQNNFGAKYDKDFPPIIIYSVPIPDVVKNVESQKETLKILRNTAVKLENDGCDFIVIACNSVQFLLNKIKKVIKIPLIGIAEVNVQAIKVKNYKKIGILATKTTIEMGLYEKELKKINTKLIKPNRKNQTVVTQVIMTQLAGKIKKADKGKLLKVTRDLKNKGAEAILIACTDLSSIIKQKDINISLIDCTEIYAQKSAELSASN